jgi:DNA-nicking Smr family endonuclease
MTDPRLRRARPLTAEEIALWLHVTRDVRPRAATVAPNEPSRPVRPAEAAPPSARLRTAPPQRAALPPLAPLERRLRQKLQRGKIELQAIIDLHGMRHGEAHAALHRFLWQAQARGARLVLVITGKGKTPPGEGRDDPREGGILKRSVPEWLREPNMRGLVVGFETAADIHGGSGALYVRLRRPAAARRGRP